MKGKTKQMVISAMLVAMGTILSLLVLYELPFGGTVTVASMVPIVLTAYIYGTKWGLFTSFVYSLLQLVCGLATGIVTKMFLPGSEQMALGSAVLICIFDYLLAYVVLGFGGIFKNKFKHRHTEIVLGSVVAVSLRWLMHTVSGSIFYGAWAEWFFSDASGLAGISFMKGFCEWVMEHITGTGLAVFYSVVYNGAYMLPEIVITALLAPLVYSALKRADVAEK